jgi:hypothetical protein
MYALQRPQCDTRNQLPQMRLPEPAPQEQRAKSIIALSLIFSLFFGLRVKKEFSPLRKLPFRKPL